MTKQGEKKELADRPENCDNFLSRLDEIATGEDTKMRLSNAVRLIGQGFGSHPQYRPEVEEVERVEQRLLAVFEPIEVGLRLWAKKAKKQASLHRDLRNMYARRVRRELMISPITNDEEFDRLSSTLSQMVRETGTEEELATLIRKAVIALAGEHNLAVRSQLISQVLEQAADHRIRRFDATKPTPKREPHEEQLAEAVRIVSITKVDFRTVLAARTLALPMQVEVKEHRRSMDVARRDKVNAQEAQSVAEAKCTKLQERVNELESQLATHQAQLRRTLSDLETEKQKSNEIRETLTIRHAHELGGKLRQIAKALTLELEEAQICLDRDEPNAKMALNRVRDMQSILKTYMENQA